MIKEVELTSEIVIKPANEIEEILQNVRMIIGTIQGTATMYREFGIEDLIDVPINVAEARLTATIAENISKYEPRARLLSVEYENDEEGLNPRVVIEIVGTSA